jgi:hypothetical protein
MTATLEQLRADIENAAATASGQTAKALLHFMLRVTNELPSAAAGDPTADKLEIDQLKSKLSRLAELLNHHAGIIGSVQRILNQPSDQTAAQLPAWATIQMTKIK